MEWKFAHISDTHIRNLKYHKEYRHIFGEIYKILQEEGVHAIIHTGDIAHTKTQISPEYVDLAGDFLKNLADIAPLIIVLGNHDGNLRNSTRQDAITPLVKMLNHPDIHLLKNSGEFQFSKDVTFNVLSVFDKENWIKPTDSSKINIALHHGSISGCQTDVGHQLVYGENDIEIFTGFDYAFLGDIHKTNQVLDTEGRIRYPGSTIQQNHGESNDKGFLIWKIQSKDDFKVEHWNIANPKPFISIFLTPTGQIPRKLGNIPKGARLRIISENNLSLDRIRKALTIAKKRFKPEIVTFLNKSDSKANSIEALMDDFKKEDLRDIAVQERLIREYLKDFHCDDETLERVYELNRKYDAKVQKGNENARNVHFEVLELEWDNLFKYGEGNRVVFSDLSGIVGIFGKNYSGKSSIIDTLLYCMFNNTSKKVTKNLRLINHHRDSCQARAKLRIGHKTFTIVRSSEKYIKKLHGNETVEAKTSVDFSVFDEVTGEERSLNGETRGETDLEISKYFGTLEDFLLTSMTSQMGAMAFIDEKSTKRKEVLGRFLDIAFFSKKHTLANDDAKELRGVLRKLEDRDFLAEEAKAHDELMENARQKTEREAQCKELKSAENKLEQQISEIDKKIADVPTKLINIKKVLRDLKEIEQFEVSKQAEQEEYQKVVKKTKVWLDKMEVPELETLKGEKHKITSLLEETESELHRSEVSLAKLEGFEDLKNIPCGTEYGSSCPFIRKAHIAEQAYESMDEEVRENRMIVNDFSDKLLHLNERLDKRKQYEHSVVALSNLAVELNDTNIRKETLLNQKNIWEENKAKQEELESLEKEKSDVELLLTNARKGVAKCDKALLEIYKEHGSLEQKLLHVQQLKEELKETREKYEAFDLYLRCMHPSGIAYDIIKRSLPAINSEIAKILTNIVEFQVFFVNEGKRLDIYIKRPKDIEPTLIELCSGAEKAIAAMAIRLAFISISSVPHGDIFILDEPGTSLDAENMEGFIRILDLVKSFFKCVLLISHLETLKDAADTLIDIQKRGNHAFVDI